MVASVLIEYSVKSLNKVFDYKITDNVKKLKVGHKVIVPFGKKNVEGFVLDIHNDINDNIEYKEIVSIVNDEFCLTHELIELGKVMSKKLLCNQICCYQAMLPKALKASIKTKINKKYITKIKLNDKVDIEEFINNCRYKSQIFILNSLKKGSDLKSNYSISSVNKLLEKGIIIQEKIEINRDIYFIEENKKNIELTTQQQKVFNQIINSKNNKFLLHGVTGSGKTEIYIKLIEKYLKENKSVIVLVPEISLTPQIASRFKSVFKTKVAIFHSALSEGEKYDEYRKIMRGEVSVVVGARSAIFMPLKNIGLIIIDECQSSTYKQDNNPKYNAIDIAILRSEYNNSKLVLGSATPLLEQYARAQKGIFELVDLPFRISNKFPQIELVDMEIENKKHNYIISAKLDNEIKKSLNRNEQVILLLNRRGYSTYLSCSNCGYVYKCPNCDISLIYHKNSNSYSCHYCGYKTLSNNICPNCKEEAIKDFGLGTEKLQKLIEDKYNISVLRMDSDTTSYKNAHQKLIDDFKTNKYKILIGTQMISKGLNFENVSLVGIINADSSLSIPDFRSSEKTYELLSQTSGRVGRFNIPGKVLIQTYNKDHYVFNTIIKNDYLSFYKYEMNIRRNLKYPPYYYICNILIMSKDYKDAFNNSNKIKKYLDNNLNDEFIILGPSMSMIFKLKNNYRFSIMIKYKKELNLLEVLDNLNNIYFNNKCSIDININV